MFDWLRHHRRKRLHPVHLKGELVAVMRRDKRELPHGDYAPNYYQILLSSEDFQRWAGLKWKIIDQYCRYLATEIREEEYALEADLFIDIQPSSRIPVGEFVIDATFQDARPVDEPTPLFIPMLSHEDGILQTPPSRSSLVASPADTAFCEASEDDDGTMILASDRSNPVARSSGEQAPLVLLKVLEGEDSGLSFYIEQVPVVVGRIGKGADIALRDAQRYISRQQFEISQIEDGSFQLIDLRSRHDLKVYVNGEQAEPAIPLYSGDHIRLGTAQRAVAEMEFTVL